VRPSKNNLASKSLSEAQVEINTKKVVVNVQVKAVISLIETISNIMYVIFISITVRYTYLSMIQNMILYMVVIPYTFLMNTSDNKNRVVEYGWRNVFQNLPTRSPAKEY
jgi:hypothetical protein